MSIPQFSDLTLHEERPARMVASPLQLVTPQVVPAGAGVVTGEPRSEPRVRPAQPTLPWRRWALPVADLVSGACALGAMLTLVGRIGLLGALAFSTIVVALGKVGGFYEGSELRIVNSTLDEAPKLLTLSGLAVLAIMIAQPAVIRPHLTGSEVAGTWLALWAALIAGRLVVRALDRRTAAVERCLVIGGADQAQRIDEKLRMSGTRAEIIAAVPLSAANTHPGTGLASDTVLDELVHELRADRIILAPEGGNNTEVIRLVRAAKAVGVRVSLLHGALDFVGSTIEFDDVHGMTLVGVRSFGLSPVSCALKRAFDLLVATVALIALSPLLLIIAIAIRRDSRGPVFFRQVRVGRDGKYFEIFKFRSMVADADDQKDSLRELNDAGDGMFKMRHDPRVTRVGRVLRRTSLDELPQILNVLRGEMSLVGPRPLVIEEDESITGLDRCRLSLAPGMTGPWQVLPTRVPKRDMIEIDYRYADNWSLWLDLKILLRTVRHVLRAGNH
jgi:exopolysaccharide biosynthesis polyprenyl glycosylphosphotransferase